MTFENVFMALTFLSSAVALYFATKKQSHDTDNIDADTISKLYDLIDKQENRYQSLRVEFDAYKINTASQIADIAGENVKLRRWAKRMAAQLEQAGIVPVKFDE